MPVGYEATACHSVQSIWYSCLSCTSPESINQSVSPFHPVNGSLVLTCCPTCKVTDPRDFYSGFLVLFNFPPWSVLDHRTCLPVVSLALHANLFCCEKKPKSLKTGWDLRLLSCNKPLPSQVAFGHSSRNRKADPSPVSPVVHRLLADFQGLHVHRGNKSSFIHLAGSWVPSGAAHDAVVLSGLRPSCL